MKYIGWKRIMVGFVGGMFVLPQTVLSATTYLTNPIQYNTIYDFVRAMLGVVVQIGIVVLGIMLIYSGFLFITAQGNTQKLEEAKKAFIWVVIGGAIVLGAWGLSLAIADTISSITPTT